MNPVDLHQQLQGGQLQTILATIPVGVFITDAEGKIVSVNDRAREIWGGMASCDGVREYEKYRGWWPDTGEPLQAEDWAAARALRGESVEVEMIDIERFDGGRATIINSAAPLRDEQGQITGAVIAVQDVTEQRERQRANELLLEALGALAGSLELTEVLGRLVSVLHEMVGHTRAAAFLWREADGQLELAAVMGEPSARVGARLPLSKYSVEMRRVVEQRARVLADYSTVPQDSLGMAGFYGISRSLLLPLVRGDKLLGVVSVDEMREGVEFTERDIELAEGIASSAALAVENAKLYEAEHHVATTLQRALLAVPDSMRGVTFAHAYRSASEEAFVGGDFYDLFEIERELAGVLIGDIAGKGLDAAVLTQLVKNTVRAHAAEKGNSSAAILSLTNNVFFQMTSSDMFATAFFGVLDRSTGRLAYTNAGHTTAIVWRQDGRLEELSANSPLLGAFPDRTFLQSEVRLGPNDVLVLYTDGVTEARSAGKQYGEERLLQAVAEAAEHLPDTVVRSIVDSVLRFTGGSLSDDLAVLVLQRSADERRMPLRHKLAEAVS